MTVTPRFDLPLLAAGQAQKEMFHNEALGLIDALLHPCVEALDVATPPVAPQAGQAWGIGAAPTGDWTGRAMRLAQWTEGGWRFIMPTDGLSMVVRATGKRMAWWDGGWVRVGPTLGVGADPISAPTGGAFIDVEARAAISAMLDTMRAHGFLTA